MTSAEYVVLLLVQFIYGCIVMANNTLVSLLLKTEFGFSEEEVGYYFTVMAAILFFLTIYAFKAMVGWVGEYR